MGQQVHNGERTERESLKYTGKELDIFAQARKWKKYWAETLLPYVSGDVLEVGAGLGANTAEIYNPNVKTIHCVEPDEDLAARLRETLAGSRGVKVSCGTIASLSDCQFDTVLYIDVLEHIADDRGELERAAGLLRADGRLIVLSPAHPKLFSVFDRAIGHYRRYTTKTLKACTPSSCRLEKMQYLDSMGMLASSANVLLLKQSLPTLRQIQFWDRYIIPVSRVIDPLLGYRVGKSIVGIWRKI
jgi:2-polyprenyl-3-methyl-5-hydroxy-6-metoxy-1,4-benzoquinol methylase